MLRKDPTNLEAKKIHYSEEHPLNKTNQNFLEQNPADQAQPHPYQSFVFGDYQSPVVFDIKPDPVGPIITNPPVIQTQVVTDKAKEYGMNKPTPFTGNQTKIRRFLLKLGLLWTLGHKPKYL
jgi:hypothetical protein